MYWRIKSIYGLLNVYIFVAYKYLTMMNVKELDADRLEIAANMLKAIAHPLRIAMLKHLEGGKKLTVTEIHELLGIEQSTASHHLGILKDKGVLCSRREGKNILYYLKHDILSQIIDCLQKCTCE
jgi:DNA-binding transcriptional ArsR family regulator